MPNNSPDFHFGQRPLHLAPGFAGERSDRSCECNCDPGEGALNVNPEPPHPVCRCIRIDKPTSPPQSRGRGEDIPLLTTFGTAGALDAGGLRKNVQRVIDLFRSAFPTEPDVRLRVKITPSSPTVNAHGDSRIDVIAHSLSPADLAEWYRSLSAYVNGSFGEGFGLHLLEAMACGRPLISTTFSGVGEFFDRTVGYEIGYRLVEARNAIYSGRWADPNDEDMMAAMRRVYRDPAEAERLGKASAERAAAFTWERTSRRLIEVLAQHGFLP